ncbi:23S rRNA (adenine(2503)-C(2))-methyltransferase RlmN, partial [Buchnera aphidicola (Hormaphis cornu)]
FCSTGAQGFIRNLFVSEIIGQVLQAFKYISTNTEFPNIKNIVIMGMGEPLLNFSNIINVIKILLDKRAFKLSKQHITLSTSGIVPGINKLRKSRIDIRLAISLHAPNDNLRNKIMPINYRYNIANMLLAVKQYIQYSKANRGGVTIEYVMLAGINDSSEHARQLAKLLSTLPSKINLIPWNSFFGSTFSCSSDQKIFNFYKILTGKGLTTTIRNNRGKDINAACGQLSGQISTTKKIEKIQIIF